MNDDSDAGKPSITPVSTEHERTQPVSMATPQTANAGGEVASDQVPATGAGWFTDDEPPGAVAEFLTDMADTLRKMARDVANMEVRTYVSDELGNLDENGSDLPDKARLRAYTRSSLDGDTDACVPTDEGRVDELLWRLHTDMVRQAQLHRSELLKSMLALMGNWWR